MIEEEFLAESRSLIKCMSFTFFLSDSLWRPSQRSWVQEKSTKLIVPRLGVLRFVTQPYTEPNVTPSHHQVVSTWYGLYGQDHVFTGELQLNVNHCRPNHYCRGIIGPAQTKIGKYTSFFPTIYFEFAIHLQQQFTCTWEVLRSLYVLHTYILDKQGRYKWYSKIHCSL